MPQKNTLSGKTQGIWEFCQTQGIWFAQVMNSLILKKQDILIFAGEFPNSSNSVKLTKLSQISEIDTGKILIVFEWGPCM